MSHELDVSTGRVAMAYVGERPWHGLGTELQDDVPMEVWTHAAGFDWQARTTAVEYHPMLAQAVGNAVGEMRALDDRVVVYRSDTGAPLSVVSDRYIPAQPVEVMDVFAKLSQDMGFKMRTAGCLKGGQRIWGMAEAPEGFNFMGDMTSQYLLLSTSYDGSSATLVTPTAVRVVCQNTLSMALTGARPIRIQHREPVTAAKVIERTHLVEAWAKYQEMVRRLSDRFVPEPLPILTAAYYNETLDAAKQRLDKDDKGVASFVKRLEASLESAPGAYFAKGSAYALLNAVTYDVDHAKPARSEEQRMLSAIDGEGARIKQRVLEVIA